MSKTTESSKSQGRLNRGGFWRGHITRCESLGVSIAAYCRERELCAASYHWWKRTLKKRDARVAAASGGMSPMPAVTNAPLPFAEVTVVGPGAAPAGEENAAIEVTLAGGRRVGVRPGFDAATLAQVLRVVEGLGC